MNVNENDDRLHPRFDMTAHDPTERGFSLKRWSQRKLEATRGSPEPVPASVPAPVPSPAPVAGEAPLGRAAHGVPAAVSTPVNAAVTALPPVESLTIDSDFSVFLRPKVDAALTRQALKQLFRDPHFNVMDRLDVYIDDYTQADPISADVVRTMVQSRYIFDPPKTRVNSNGVVEDVTDEVAEGVAPPDASPGTVAPVAPTNPEATKGPAPDDSALVPSMLPGRSEPAPR